MSESKVKVEIYEGDPFTGCCGPGIASTTAADGMRKMFMKRSKTVKTLREEFKGQIEIERDILSSRRKGDSYPQYTGASGRKHARSIHSR